jgi:hypothetical protein
MFEPVMWFAGVLIALLAATVFLIWLRGRMGEGTQDPEKLSFTLSDLLHQRDQGRLTTAEYESLKEVVIRDAKAGSIQANETKPDKVL